MDTLAYFKEHFDQLQSANAGSGLNSLRQHAFQAFSAMGIPTMRQEEWKYTRISGLFNKEYRFAVNPVAVSFPTNELDAFRLPGHEQANELVFINGIFSQALSVIRSSQLQVMPLEEAAVNEYKHIVFKHLGHSAQYLKDGINALSTAFIHGAVFIHIKRGYTPEHPVYIYHVSDAREANTFSQPRSLIYLDENASMQVIETFITHGPQESFTNHVTEIAVEKDARLEYYKIQNDASHASQVSSTHIRQTGKSYTHSVVISLNGALVRNNLNVVMDATRCESHLFGRYCLKGQSHIDHHTVVDNMQPNCFSNELYKGIMDDNATGVFNGKIYVRRDAQKTNAYQSNKNILLSDNASVNTKPQLEIYADDVKCSHGCTVGSLDEEALFYLRSRGVSRENAKALLLQAFAMDILENIHPAPIRSYIDQLISERLELI